MDKVELIYIMKVRDQCMSMHLTSICINNFSIMQALQNSKSYLQSAQAF